jgi:general secretion pathway protein J
MAPTLVASRTALRPEGADGRGSNPANAGLDGLQKDCVSQSGGLQGGLAWGGPALRPCAVVQAGVIQQGMCSGEMSRKRGLLKPSGGFTLIELLVAISVMALLAVLSWRGLDGMARAQAQTRERADEVLRLQAGLSQWKVDLDAITRTPGVTSIDWDGRVMRMTRRSAGGNDGLMVVAWTRRLDGENGGRWLRWQSPAARNIGNWQTAWERAAVWAQTPSAEDRQREVAIAPLMEWQIYYYRNNAWTNSLSSDAGSVAPPTSLPGGQTNAVPDGVRLVLSLPAGQALAGALRIDWVQPTLGGER